MINKNWRHPTVLERIRFLEKMVKKLQDIIQTRDPSWKPSREDIEEGIVTEELCKVALNKK